MRKKLLAILLVASLAAAGCGSAPAATTSDNGLQSSRENEKSGKVAEKSGTENQTDSQDKVGINGNEDLTEATDPQAEKDIASSGNTQTTSKKDNSSGSSGSAGVGSAGSGTGSAEAGAGTGGGSGNGSSGGSNRGSNTGTPSAPPKQDGASHVCNHNWVEITETVNHKETGHYESKVVKEAWDEQIKEPRVVCGCGKIFTSVEAWADHGIDDDCPWGYSVRDVIVNTIHHAAETEQVWVVDKAAWTEVVSIGKYKCSICGENK